MSTIRSVVALARDRNITYHSASVAYYAFVSIIPLVLLAVAIASFVGGQSLATQVTNMLGQQLSSSGQESVTQALTSPAGRGTASVVGFITLTWSALKLFLGLDQAFDQIYVDDVEASLFEQIKDAIIVILGITFAVALVVAIGVVLSAISFQIPFINVIGTLALVGVLTVALLPIYYVLPPIEVTVRDILPGTIVAAVGWVILQVGFRIYAANASRYAAYGVIGAILLFVTWLYFAAIVLLLGAAVNAVRQGIRTETTAL
jgi:membrane protein